MRRWFSSRVAQATAGGAIIVSWLAALPAMALTQPEIIEKLGQVPVFLILNSEGRPLTASASRNDTEVKVPVVFTDGDTAEEFLADAREQDADAQVIPVDLGTLYQETQVQADRPPSLLYFPDEQALEAAVTLENDFQGVPLFIARQGSEGPYLTVTREGETFLPMFFSEDDLQRLLTRYREQDPQASQEIEVEVLSLEWLLQMMSTNEDPVLDEQLSQIQLVPSAEVVEYLRAQSNSGAEGQ